jgi:hypothetical protein
LSEGRVIGFWSHHRLGRADVLGVGSLARSGADSGIAGVSNTYAEDRVARLELRHRSAHRFDLTGKIGAQTGVLRLQEPGHYPSAAPRLRAIERVDGSRVDSDQDFAVRGQGHPDVREADDFRRSVPVVDSGFHKRTILRSPILGPDFPSALEHR